MHSARGAVESHRGARDLIKLSCRTSNHRTHASRNWSRLRISSVPRSLCTLLLTKRAEVTPGFVKSQELIDLPQRCISFNATGVVTRETPGFSERALCSELHRFPQIARSSALERYIARANFLCGDRSTVGCYCRQGPQADWSCYFFGFSHKVKPLNTEVAGAGLVLGIPF